MTIQNRLKFIVLVPSTLLIVLSSYFFITSYLNYQKANSLKTILENNAYLSSAATEIGKERGLTAMYLGGDKHIAKSSLIKQRQNSNKTLLTMKQNIVMADKTYLPSTGKEKTFFDTLGYQNMLAQLKNIHPIRQRVEHENIKFSKVFFHDYSKTLTSPILQNLLYIKNFALTTEISSLISTLSQLYIAKENSALERGLVSYYITRQVPMPLIEIAQWETFKTKANLFDISQIDDKQLQLQLKNIFSKEKNKKIFTKLATLSFMLQKEILNGEYTTETIHWFVLQTEKISLLSKSELIVSHTLWDKSHAFLKKQLILLGIAGIIVLLSLLLAYLAFRISKEITKNTDEIKPNITEEKKKKKKILIAKTCLLERRILIKVIENLGYAYLSLDDVDTLEQELASGEYDLLFTDSVLVTDNIKEFDSVYIITSNKSKEEIVGIRN